MNQDERRIYLIRRLMQERQEDQEINIPVSREEQRMLLRSLMNIRLPKEIDIEFLKIQDEYLSEVNRNRGIVALSELPEIQPDIYIWKGDITRLKTGAIVNAANSGMTGCYHPCHNCIDNCIHTYAGIQLRLKCAEIMKKQGYDEPTGQAKVTPAYNLPCDYVIHTVGPIVEGPLTETHENLLASCYQSCLEAAAQYRIASIAFCCISTGVFRFPNQRAAEIAVRTVSGYKERTGSPVKVIFNVFKDKDEEIYRNLLGGVKGGIRV